MYKKIKSILVIGLVGVFFLSGCCLINNYQNKGSLGIEGLKEKVRVVRDEKGMAYIYAANTHDALMAQGFVTAQDRLFQMQLTRLFAEGRISELAGEQAKNLDIRMHTIGFLRHAQEHAAILNDETLAFFQAYLDGVNTYIRTHKDEWPTEFKIAGIKPEPWDITDSLAILYYMGWDSSANLTTEIISEMLIEKIGIDRAQEISPVNINPDDKTISKSRPYPDHAPALGINAGREILSFLQPGHLNIGSNNWATSGTMAIDGKPILANDPHLETSLIPGQWYPCGIITPGSRAVGVVIPGIPGMVIGRTNNIAMGVTNAYGDTQDLYVEKIDPSDKDRYMEGDKSIPFGIIEETLKIKDKDMPSGFREEAITIRTTNRGPVVSGILPDLTTDKVISLRWSAFETMSPSIGIEKLFCAKDVYGARDALKEINMIILNFVFADTSGNIGWYVSGRIPVRSGGGIIPYEVKDSIDNWQGWIPLEEMPQAINPARQWLGTCNHKTVPADYPYYYSNHFSASDRYQRLKQLMDTPGKKSVDDHFMFQRDTMNLTAKRLSPIMAASLMNYEDTQGLGAILNTWTFRDDPDLAAPAVFQAVFQAFAQETFADELGDDLSGIMLSDWYYWKERLCIMACEGDSPWFDNVNTKDTCETMDDTIHTAGLKASAMLEERMGKNPEKWEWGRIHQLCMVNALRREGIGKGILGGGSHPMGGSGATLYRSIYEFNEPFKVWVTASLRMVADLGDDTKVLAVLPGGVSGRLFDPHYKDQTEAFMEGEKMYWWLSDEEIKRHQEHVLVLNPM
ncbi:MAG: penicillin acylase family protein [Thermodesulfobacteriota bacterium]|nr:penicillin acylase family protein [Thermodesulfobacteriota bacterium]